MLGKKEDFKKTLEEISQLAERKLAQKLRKHEGSGRKKRLTGEEVVSEIGREVQELEDKKELDWEN